MWGLFRQPEVLIDQRPSEPRLWSRGFGLAATRSLQTLAVLALVAVGVLVVTQLSLVFIPVTIALVLVLQLVFQSWHTVTGGSNGLVVPRPFPDMLRPEHHRAFYFIFLGLLALALVLWALVNHSRFGAGLKAVREDEDKAESILDEVLAS